MSWLKRLTPERFKEKLQDQRAEKAPYMPESVRREIEATAKAEAAKKPAPVVLPDDPRQLAAMAQQAAKAITRREIKKNTRDNYARLYRAMITAKQTPLEYARAMNDGQGTTKGVYHTLKAAYQRGLANHLQNAANVVYKPLSVLPADDPARAKALAYIQRNLPRLLAQRPDYEGKRLAAGEACAYADPARRRQGKRLSLRGLPDDWREQMIEKATPKHKLTMAVLAATGCRPAELQAGIEFRRTGPYEITATWDGAKQKHDEAGNRFAGGGVRSVVIDASTYCGMTIAQALPADGSPMTVQVGRWAARDAIDLAADRCGKKFDKVSAYSFRHQFSADLKAAKVDPATIAEMMGHDSEESQKNYGEQGQGRGGGGGAKPAAKGGGPRRR